MRERKKNSKAVNNLVHGLFLLATVVFAALAGCAGKSFSDLRSGIEARGHYIEGVPFVRQGEDDCGPAALSGVLAYWGRPSTMDEITSRVYTPKLRGSLPMDMERFARDEGLKTESSAGAGTLESLKALLQANQPVICLLDLGFGPFKQPHYVIVIGYDDGHSVVVMHDGGTPDRLMPYDAFDRAWSKAGRWMLVVRD